ncbi:MAG: ribonuclease Z [Deltaproteobacteria bacterium]|nr:ribonuclease Z [Deltaproteobacteria bacterium]
MKLTILGSGTNLHPTRAAAGYLLQTDNLMLLDFGPRTLSNLLKTDVNHHHITHILFSHFHADHFSDFITFFFDAVIYAKHQGGVRPDLTIIGPRETKKLMRAIMTSFPSFSPPPFGVTFKEVGDRRFTIGDTTVTPRTMTHVPDLHAVGYRIDYRGQAVAYSGDTQYCDNVVRLCADADVGVLDCSWPANKPGPAHLHARDCGRVASEAGLGRLVLSHFYPIAERYDVKGQAGEIFKGPIVMARDRLAVKF